MPIYTKNPPSHKASEGQASKIYTKKGDKGLTKTFHGAMSKGDELAEVLGSIDELNTYIGLCRKEIQITNDKFTNQIQKELKRIQTNLMTMGSQLAGAKGQRLKGTETKRLEKLIDKLTGKLPPLSNFIYPIGELQVARAVARRVERNYVKFINNTLSNPPLNLRGGRGSYIIKYLNRLSDGLFTMARWVNFKSGIPEETWK